MELPNSRYTDETCRLALHRYEGQGRLALAKGGPAPDIRLHGETRALATAGTMVKTDGLLMNNNVAERIEIESEDQHKRKRLPRSSNTTK